MKPARRPPLPATLTRPSHGALRAPPARPGAAAIAAAAIPGPGAAPHPAPPPPSRAPGDGVTRVPPPARDDGITAGPESDAQEKPRGGWVGHPRVAAGARSEGKVKSSHWGWVT